ncbi:MAG: hypothetical protein HOO99_15910, partial [Hyphomicrobiaceae bacterium]|nr:hypothetical protein [Hyphomicrobiaceae bacterium]
LEIAPWLPLAEPEPTPRLILVETVTPIARQDQHSGPPAQSFEFLECPPQPKAKSLPTAKSEAPSYGRHQALDAFALYNDLALKCGLPQAAKLTPQREKAVIARLKTYGIEGWLKALVKIEKSSFLRGRNDRNWRADLDFLLQASSFDKVIDGRYDDPNLAKNASGSQKTEAEREKARREMRAVAGLSS